MANSKDDKKSTKEMLLQAGGVIATGVSTIGVVVSAFFLWIDDDGSAEAEISKATISAQVERERIASEERQAKCKAAMDYAGDEATNRNLPPQVQAALDESVMQTIRSCTISYRDGFGRNAPVRRPADAATDEEESQ